jgi:hypothetical protein
MYATISAEGSDSFDALSRSYSYVYQAPWHYLWYGLVAVAYGVVVVFFVGLMGSLMVYLGKWGLDQTPWIGRAMKREPAYLFAYAPTSFGWRELLLQGSPAVYTAEDIAKYSKILTKDDIAKLKKEDKPVLPASKVPEGVQRDILADNFKKGAVRSDYMEKFGEWSWANYIGAWMVAFWLGLVFLLIVGFGYSYFWSASTIIYLLMRKKVDETEIDEVHLEEDEVEEPYTPPAPPPPSGAPAARPAAGGPGLIPPESLTLRTPPGPTEGPPPPAPPPAAPPPPPAPPSPPVGETAPPPAPPPPTPPATEGGGNTPGAGGDGNPPL